MLIPSHSEQLLCSAIKSVKINEPFICPFEYLIEQRIPEPIYLKIYHVSYGFNYCSEMFGFGLYHTSVSVYNLEFSYGGHDEASPGCVVVNEGQSGDL
jgi:hypothetical protein